MSKVELLAPAGDMTCFKAAIAAGADAVYLGGEEYGARAYASNFTGEELCEAIRYAHLFGVKVYLTVNTLVKERELEGICRFLTPFYQAGLDGVIVQDFGVLKIIREHFPDLELHGSTQMCVTGKYGAGLLKQQGVCRIVPARELSLEEITDIKRETGMEIETFIHGAMCYAYSGQCLFSSFLGGRSGNRGRCAGPCRLPYSAFGQKDVYPLSLKDMCTLPILHELIEAGIDSFKIEGRMKNPYYVAGVTAVYRKYIDLYEKSKAGQTVYEIDKEDMQLLKNLYVRTELETGYYHRHNGAELITLQKPGYLTGAEKDFLSIKEKYLDQEKKLPLYCELKVQAGDPLMLTVWKTSTEKVSVYGNHPVEKALNRPIGKQDLVKQLSKTGNTPFHFESVSVIMDEDVFIPIKEINELRRQALAEINRILTTMPHRGTRLPDMPHWNMQRLYRASDREKLFKILVTTPEQLETAVSFWKQNVSARVHIAGIAIHSSLLEIFAQDIRLSEWTEQMKLPFYLCLPQTCRKQAIQYCEQFLDEQLLYRFQGFYCGNPDALGYISAKLQKAGTAIGTKEIIADYSLYTANSEAAALLQDCKITGMVGSYELNHYEWEELLGGCRETTCCSLRTEYLVYGHVPFMQSAGCVKKTFGKCDGQNTMTILTDRRGKQLPVLNFCGVCENTVYNGVPLMLYDELEQIVCDDYRISFTVENKEQTAEVLDHFILDRPLLAAEFTKGHYKKGIE